MLIKRYLSRKTKYALVFFIAAFIFSWWWFSGKNSYEVVSVNIGPEVVVTAQIAGTPMLQQIGLSRHRSLDDGAGMLFVFDRSSRYDFWMKDMDFPIDIIWMDGGGYVVYIEHELQPESYPETYGPAFDSQYVLEVPSGFSRKHNIEIGQKITW